ncbi:MAG: hypothetical protein ACM3ZE_18435 [Myxococcales bacterium]
MMLSRRTQFALSVTSALVPVWVASCGGEYEKPNPGAGGAPRESAGASSVGGGAQAPAAGGATQALAVSGATGGAGVSSSTTGTGGVTVDTRASTASGGTAVAGGGTTASSIVSTVICNTAPTTKPSEVTTFGCGKAGFELNASASSNNNATFAVTKVSPLGGPRNLCDDGCAVLTLPFVTGDVAWSKGAVVDKGFASTTSLVGSKIVARIAINKASLSTPIQFKLFAQTGSPDWIMAERAVTDTSEYALSTGAKDYEYVIVDRLVAGKQFCSAQTMRYGLQVQTAGSITEETAGSVSIYIQSISLITPAAGAGGASGVGGCGATPNGGAGSAGKAGYAGNAGNAGAKGT